MLLPHQVTEIAQDGFTMCPGLVTRRTVGRLASALASANIRAGGKGLRNLLRRIPAVHRLAVSPPLQAVVGAILGADARPVRAILFDKTPHANWGVGWHQDLTIAVERQVDISGFRAWTVKDGVPHVQAPVEILQNMLTVRVHLDAADARNGALFVAPGTHRSGRLAEPAIAETLDGLTVDACSAAPGDVLVFRPLLLHMSPRSQCPSCRRVIQIEYAAADLPAPLAWHAA